MAVECYEKDCPFHEIHFGGEEPLCFEERCIYETKFDQGAYCAEVVSWATLVVADVNSRHGITHFNQLKCEYMRGLMKALIKHRLRREYAEKNKDGN